MPESHTGDNIAVTLTQSLEEWGITSNRVSAFTTDRGANMLSAMKKMSVASVPCVGHTLHNAVNKSLDDQRITRALGLCRKIVSAFNCSCKMKHELGVVQLRLGLPVHKFMSDVPTRWASKYHMVERIIEQQSALTEIFSAG